MSEVRESDALRAGGSPQPSRREELLSLAAEMFAERGLRATTVRDIADAAGILSGSLYHHFDSKEAIVDELLRDFLEGLFARYREIAAANLNPVDTLKGLFLASFDAIETKHAQVAIYQAGGAPTALARTVRLPQQAQHRAAPAMAGSAA